MLDVEPTDVEPPLGDFQHTRAVKPDVFRLIQTINSALQVRGEKPLTEGVLERVFERNWPELELRLQSLRESQQKRPERARTDREVLDDILSLVRQRPSSPATLIDAALAERLFKDPPGGAASRAQTNRAFVYVVRLDDSRLGVSDAVVASIERLDGLVTCRLHVDEVECVFLRPAESDLVGVLATADVRARVAVSRSATFDWVPEEKPKEESQEAAV